MRLGRIDHKFRFNLSDVSVDSNVLIGRLAGIVAAFPGSPMRPQGYIGGHLLKFVRENLARTRLPD